MIAKTCCFTGHRDLYDDTIEIKQNLKKTIITLIKNDVSNFITGGARGFDTVAAETVIELKKAYPEIQLILALPCRTQTSGWLQTDIEKYNFIISKSDKIVILSEKYYTGCMQVRNRYMVDNSKHIIGYQRKNTGGTAYTLNYAKKKCLSIIQI